MTDTFDNRHDHLPAELRAALEEFGAWSQRQLLVEQNESTPTGPLYHYTNEEALLGILSKQQIWCFRHLHQRDKTEFEYSLQIAREVKRSVGWSNDPFERSVCTGLDDMLEVNSIVDAFEFYMFSLSRHRDDRQQWLEYGAKGLGFAIGFAPSLLQPDKDTLSDKASENLHVGRVIYGDEATRARHRLVMEKAADITSRYGKANIEMPRDKELLIQFLNAMEKEVIASQLVWNCLTAKHLQYENEREARYVIMNVPGKFDDIRKSFRDKDYVEADLPLKEPGSIKEILVGPLAPPKAEAMVATLLKDVGYPEDIPICRSAIAL
ncbi:DUF2971 domain-containing protein [Bradyrhizobium sp. NP1]|uniref:DUF2971 domain-containing protein n=1 Tax=Bradyrhizobium sp. NP1 TaxID=3049772 RepID=UPI0025A63E2F|nr:DUF2971 domain-containing protein [Bradyrhizobium sp. NP1]WJR75490.1 DUF2971 domain-containing protein [Bradyrhizobium sp. NP1]